MNALIDLSLRNRFVVCLVWLLAAGVGLWSMSQLPIDAVPDVTNVQVQVLTTAAALAPEEIERFITFPVESAMSGLPRIEEIRSVSQFGLSAVTIVFEEGTNIYWARQMVGERLGEAKERIPRGMGTPTMGPISTGLGEIFQFEVKSQPGFRHSLMELREVLDWTIAYRLRATPGVIEVNTSGGELKTYEIQIQPDKLLDFNISVTRVLEALRRNNVNQGGGYLVHDQEQRIVRGEGLIGSLEDLGNVVLASRADDTPVFIRDVGSVRFAPRIRQGAATRDGKGEAVVGIVMLLMGENSRVVVDRVKQTIADIEKTLPEGVMIEPFYDRTELVRSTIHTVGKNLIEGGVLVVVVLLVLLGSVKAGLVVALAVPLAMLGAFIGMLSAGLSGNLMSLGAIDFGLIVDGSVVMIENIIRRSSEHRRETGSDASMKLVRNACREVARPVTFGVIIIMLVYLPILSLRGLEGKMFRPMALTVLFALTTSLFIALTLMPVLGSLLLRKRISEHETILIRWAKWMYSPGLRWAVEHPRWVVGVAAAFFLISAASASRLGAVFIPKLDEGSIAIQAIRLPSVSLEASTEMTTRMEKALLEFPEVLSVISKTGRPEIANDPMTVNVTDVIVTLHPKEEWKTDRSKEELVEAMRETLADRVPSNAFSFSQPIELRVQELIAGVRSDVGVSVYGDDLAVLKEKGEEIARAIKTVPGASDVQVEQVAGLPYLRIQVDRARIARYGIDVADVLEAVAAIGGVEVDSVLEGQRRFPLQVRFAPAWRSDVERLREIKISDPRGRQIPLEQLAVLTMEEGPAQISRSAIRRRLLVQCNVTGRDLASFVSDAQTAVDRGVKLPSGYSVAWGGQFKNLTEAADRLLIAVPVALFLIFVILHLTFNSIQLGMLIFLNVPMAATGGILALWLRGMPFSISAGVGFIALFGVAVLNGVVLVSTIVELRREGKGEKQAVLEGSLARLRPVLMTALVATLGFVPMALSSTAGAEVQRPLATVVIGGLATSTLLTLFVLPAIYSWFEPKGLMVIGEEDEWER